MDYHVDTGMSFNGILDHSVWSLALHYRQSMGIASLSSNMEICTVGRAPTPGIG